MQNWISVLDLEQTAEFGVRILLAVLLGGVIGFERERQQRPAGLRTFMLVSVGSCIFTLISYHGFIGGDPARVAAQIVSGIGFLGAGVTIQRKGTVYGLTSAAGIWAVAAVGMAVGTGRYYIAVFSTLAIAVVLGLLRHWFKADVEWTTRRTLQVTLRQVRSLAPSEGQSASSPGIPPRVSRAARRRRASAPVPRMMFGAHIPRNGDRRPLIAMFSPMSMRM